MPIIKKENFEDVNWNKVEIVNYKSLNSVNDPNNTIVIMFNYDEVLERIWKDPLANVARFQSFLAVATPDFSIYEKMNKYDIDYNVYKSRWIGATWQSLKLRVIPTITWSDESSYDIAFKGIEKNSVVIISTIGCQRNKEFFLKGYNAMMERLQPDLIIIFGNPIKGLYGNVIYFNYKESFSKHKKYEQLSLFEIDRIQYIPKEVN